MISPGQHNGRTGIIQVQEPADNNKCWDHTAAEEHGEHDQLHKDAAVGEFRTGQRIGSQAGYHDGADCTDQCVPERVVVIPENLIVIKNRLQSCQVKSHRQKEYVTAGRLNRITDRHTEHIDQRIQRDDQDNSNEGIYNKIKNPVTECFFIEHIHSHYLTTERSQRPFSSVCWQKSVESGCTQSSSG